MENPIKSIKMDDLGVFPIFLVQHPYFNKNKFPCHQKYAGHWYLALVWFTAWLQHGADVGMLGSLQDLESTGSLREGKHRLKDAYVHCSGIETCTWDPNLFDFLGRVRESKLIVSYIYIYMWCSHLGPCRTQTLQWSTHISIGIHTPLNCMPYWGFFPHLGTLHMKD